MSSLQNPVEVEGEIKIPLDLFPREILDKIISTRNVPVMEFTLTKVYVDEGVTIESSWDKAHASFSFHAEDITIKEST